MLFSKSKTNYAQKQPSVLWEYVESFLIAIALALIIRTFVIQPFKIPSGSMRPTLIEGDRILVNKYLYRFDDPQRGDVMVFKSPQTPEKDYIKRLIGVEGDSVEIRSGKIFNHDRLMNDPDFVEQNFYYNRGEYGFEGHVSKVPDESFYVLGDNSASSLDSRFWGFVKREGVVGKAFLIFWPPHRIRLIK